ncbi:MAG: exodeoxyribonuclease [Pseudomonadota bacterium]|jgi:exodeoxyribonuclease-3
MQIATWNVNSLNVRAPQVLAWLAANPVDVLCLQELKITDDKFPVQAFADAGYQAAFTGQKTYNGVALLSRTPITDVVLNNPMFEDEHRRLVTGTINGVRVICAYFPNGQAPDSDKFQYKMRWLDGLSGWLGETVAQHPYTALAGDFNIAPADADVFDPVAWKDQIHCTPQEREKLAALMNLGMVDTFRMFEQPPKLYSWWDYRQLAFRKNQGLRIDLVLASKALAEKCKRAWIDKAPRKNEQPSDHAPVVAEFELPTA